MTRFSWLGCPHVDAVAAEPVSQSAQDIKGGAPIINTVPKSVVGDTDRGKQF